MLHSTPANSRRAKRDLMYAHLLTQLIFVFKYFIHENIAYLQYLILICDREISTQRARFVHIRYSHWSVGNHVLCVNTSCKLGTQYFVVGSSKPNWTIHISSKNGGERSDHLFQEYRNPPRPSYIRFVFVSVLFFCAFQICTTRIHSVRKFSTQRQR